MKIAVVGAGPIGLEAAVEAEARGHEVVVFEAGRVAEHVRRWGHVRLFTPWSMAVTERGLARLGSPLAEPDAYPTGDELVTRYLAPLAATLSVEEHTRVESVGRTGLRKGDALGSEARTCEPFQLLLSTPEGQRIELADAVLDCGGVFGDPAPAGPGGVPAPGENDAAARGRVVYGPTRLRSGDRRVVLVGDGASAATVLDEALSGASERALEWLTPTTTTPGFASPDDDPLPARRALHDRGRDAPAHPAVHHRPGVTIRRLRAHDEGVEVSLSNGEVLDVDRVVACTGLRPDHRLSRELQVHLCWGSEGTMKLAAALLAASGGGGDCLAQPEQGPDVLRSPEPRFFVLGNKSYGRRSDFLLQRGHAQVLDALGMLEP